MKFVFVQPESLMVSLRAHGATAVGTNRTNRGWTDKFENNSIASDFATLAENATSYNNTGLPPGTTYYHVVRAANADGALADSAQASATTQPVSGTWIRTVAEPKRFSSASRFAVVRGGSLAHLVLPRARLAMFASPTFSPAPVRTSRHRRRRTIRYVP